MALPIPETPAAVVDVDRMQANLRRVAEYARAHRLHWRPHAKTHKVAALGAAQMKAGAVGLTVATPAEAEVMAGVADDLLFAYPPVGEERLRRLMELPTRVSLSVALDSRESLHALRDAARRYGRTVRVLVELDIGMRRVGVGGVDASVALAREARDAAPLHYDGVVFYPGHIRAVGGEQESALHDVGDRLARHLEALELAGVPPRVVSGGSTPTLWRSHLIPGLTEIRPGLNLFNDRTAAASGACAWNECAYSVLATVVSTAVEGQAVIDAGSKALAKEDVPGVPGYGALLDRPSLIVVSLSEEHGIIDLSATDWRPSIGEQVRVVPNHVCVSVNLQERLHGVRGDEVVAEWPVEGRRRLAAADG